jgi:hypothetical protein
MFTPSHKDLDLPLNPTNESELSFAIPFEPPQFLDQTPDPITASTKPPLGQRVQLFIYHFTNQHFVLLKRSDWELLIKVFEELETLQVAMGRWFMSVQPLQIAQPFTFKGQEWVILPTNAWQRLIQQIKNCANVFSDGLNHLQVEQIESFDLFSDLSLSDVMADASGVNSQTENSSLDDRAFIPAPTQTDKDTDKDLDHHSFTNGESSSSPPIARPE